MRALFRLSRAVAVGGMTVFLAACAHVAAGGTLPHPLLIAGILALVLVPVIALSRRKISAPAMLGVLATGQIALHEAFGALSVSASSLPVLSPAAGHVHVLGIAQAGAASTAASHVHADGILMLSAHALATLLTGIVLARGEAALWALLAWLRPLVRVLADVVPHPLPVLPALVVEVLPRSPAGIRTPARRGPPQAFTAV
ncbi:hypothetical protein SPF06_12400 [Sinomonas sp. JGH33]|uniref:MFS transporter n=1 Tax=Sinomonas terricola TaxID=3110330 RepID=A0ABU5T8V0_9MICC|nr:hypothetical protein [Sinomonas sp. JGH33]MEA5455526.1 hypothetical protein [Sinomonas sp. JGH33]